jgi:hypothetical protein
VSVSAHDNGGGATDTSAVQTFTITITGVNDAPSFTKGADQTVNEDAGAQTVSPWATAISAGPNESGQTVHFNITGNTNSGLFSAGPAVSSSGVMTYTPTANANGTATITLNIQDDGGTANGGVDTSATQTFVINVTAVNDPPSFTKGADQTVNEDTGAHTVVGWATAISPGPADEAGQAVDFIVTNDNNGLFSAQPAVDAAGQLTYTGATNAFGSATVSVSAHDNGGGATDTSAVQTFTITINAVNDAPVVTTTGGNTAFVPPGPAVVIDGGVTVSDVDSPNLAGATMSITGNFQTTEDVLAFANTANITGVYSAATGVLTLTGSDTVANYQAALRTVTYNDTAGSPNAATRTISFQVDDGAGPPNNLSNVATKSVVFNQPPVVDLNSLTPALTARPPSPRTAAPCSSPRTRR